MQLSYEVYLRTDRGSTYVLTEASLLVKIKTVSRRIVKELKMRNYKKMNRTYN